MQAQTYIVIHVTCANKAIQSDVLSKFTQANTLKITCPDKKQHYHLEISSGINCYRLKKKGAIFMLTTSLFCAHNDKIVLSFMFLSPYFLQTWAKCFARYMLQRE